MNNREKLSVVLSIYPGEKHYKRPSGCLVKINFSSHNGSWLAQLVEYRTTVREVVGSIPGQTNT